MSLVFPFMSPPPLTCTGGGNPQLLLQLEWWHSLLCTGAQVLPRCIWVLHPQPQRTQGQLWAGLQHCRVSFLCIYSKQTLKHKHTHTHPQPQKTYADKMHFLLIDAQEGPKGCAVINWTWQKYLLSGKKKKSVLSTSSAASGSCLGTMIVIAQACVSLLSSLLAVEGWQIAPLCWTLKTCCGCVSLTGSVCTHTSRSSIDAWWRKA